MTEPTSNLTPQINQFITKLLDSHGVAFHNEDDWIVLNGNGSQKAEKNKLQGAIVLLNEEDESLLTVQLDVRVDLGDDRFLIESFAGFGDLFEEAVEDALKNFFLSSFHVLVSTLANASVDDQITVERWKIDGKDRKVTVGGIVPRGNYPEEASVSWFQDLEEQIKNSQVGDGLHWVRLYYAQINFETAQCEVLLDNEIWQTVQTRMSEIAWPAAEQFYSVRAFLTICDAD